MARRLRRGEKRFDGRIFDFHTAMRKKSRAQATAQIIRDNGHRARVIKERRPGRGVFWQVWWRRGRRR